MFYESIKHGAKAVKSSLNHTIVSRRDWLSNGVVFTTEVLHFRDKSTPLKDTNDKGKYKMNAQFYFCGLKNIFREEIFLRGIQHCFLHGEAQKVLFEIQPGQRSF